MQGDFYLNAHFTVTGTYDVQAVSIDSIPGGLELSCTFASGSQQVLSFQYRQYVEWRIRSLTLGACASEGYSSWVCVNPGEISFYVCSHQPVMVPTVCI